MFRKFTYLIIFFLCFFVSNSVQSTCKCSNGSHAITYTVCQAGSFTRGTNSEYTYYNGEWFGTESCYGLESWQTALWIESCESSSGYTGFCF